MKCEKLVTAKPHVIPTLGRGFRHKGEMYMRVTLGAGIEATDEDHGFAALSEDGVVVSFMRHEDGFDLCVIRFTSD